MLEPQSLQQSLQLLLQEFIKLDRQSWHLRRQLPPCTRLRWELPGWEVSRLLWPQPSVLDGPSGHWEALERLDMEPRWQQTPLYRRARDRMARSLVPWVRNHLKRLSMCMKQRILSI